MEDMDACRFVRDLRDFDATVVMVNASGIVVSCGTTVPGHTQSLHLHGDSLKGILEECHKAGIPDFLKVRFCDVNVSAARSKA